MSAVPPDGFDRGLAYGLEVASRIARAHSLDKLAESIKAHETQALADYIDPTGKRYGYELEVTLWVNHNEATEDWGSDWRTDYRQTFYGEDARKVINAVLSK